MEKLPQVIFPDPAKLEDITWLDVLRLPFIVIKMIHRYGFFTCCRMVWRARRVYKVDGFDAGLKAAQDVLREHVIAKYRKAKTRQQIAKNDPSEAAYQNFIQQPYILTVGGTILTYRLAPPHDFISALLLSS